MGYLVKYIRHQPIGRIVLNAPDKLNAIDLPMAGELLTAFSRLADDPEVKVVILEGAGKAFCAGGDLRYFAEGMRSGSLDMEGLANSLADVLITMKTMKQVVISKVHGCAAGAGMGLALSADLCIAAESTRFIPACTQVGLAADTGLGRLLARQLGAMKAAEILILNRSLSAPEAADLGLIVQSIADDDLDSHCDELAQRILSGPLGAYDAIKQQIWQATFAEAEPYLRAEAHIQGGRVKSPEFVDYLHRFLNRPQ